MVSIYAISPHKAVDFRPTARDTVAKVVPTAAIAPLGVGVPPPRKERAVGRISADQQAVPRPSPLAEGPPVGAFPARPFDQATDIATSAPAIWVNAVAIAAYRASADLGFPPARGGTTPLLEGDWRNPRAPTRAGSAVNLVA